MKEEKSRSGREMITNVIGKAFHKITGSDSQIIEYKKKPCISLGEKKTAQIDDEHFKCLNLN